MEESNSKASNVTHDSDSSDFEDTKKCRFPPELQASILLALFHLHFVCGICNEVILDCICLPCGHNYCAHCIHQWFQSSRICPTCFNPIKEDFKLQRIYCVDEFLAELYTPIQALSTTLFGTLQSLEPHIPPKLERTVSEIQICVRNTRIVNSTSLEQRLRLKKIRRDYASNYPQHSDRRAEYSVLEQQTELFGGLYSVNLTSIVQFFLSFVTAYITYEGGDSVDNDYILLTVASLLGWFVVFMSVMRFMGYGGSFTELMLRLNFIEFIQNEVQAEEEDTTEDDEMDEGMENFSTSESLDQIHNNYSIDFMDSINHNHEGRSSPITPSNGSRMDYEEQFYTPGWDTDEDELIHSSDSESTFSSSETLSSTS